MKLTKKLKKTNLLLIIPIMLLVCFILYYHNLQSLYIQYYYERLVSLLKIYKAYDQNGPIKFVRLGKDNDGGYIVPDIAIKKSDALIGYGIDQDISFEEQFSELYHKKSYGFDCGIKSINIKNKLCHFIPECIATDKFLYRHQHSISSKKISSFAEQLSRLNLKGKKIFIKMDIEGAEFNALPEILNHAKNITGIVVEVHIFKDNHNSKAVKLLSKLREHFILVHMHAANCAQKFVTKNAIGSIPKQLELTYINKSLLTKYEISPIQKHPSLSIDMPNDPSQKEVNFEILY